MDTKFQVSEGWTVKYSNGEETATERHVMKEDRVREYVFQTLLENPGFTAQIIRESTGKEI